MSVLFGKLRVPGVTVDPDAADRQRIELTSLARDNAVAVRVVAGLISRRAELLDEDGHSATRVAIERVPQSGRLALAAAGEVLVTGANREAAAVLLQWRGFAVVGRTGPVVRLARRHTAMTEVLAACDALRELGITAAPNYVTAVAAVGKGMTGLASPRPATLVPDVRSKHDRTGAGVQVAVVDTGLDVGAASASHGWLDGIPIDDSPVGNRDLLDAVPAPDGYLDEAAGHGTFVAGLVRQAAPACEISAIKVLDSDGIGTDFAVAEALFRLAEAEVAPHIVNLSLACLAGETITPVAIDAAIDALTQRHPDTLIVAAAGNDGSDAPTWPAANKSVLSVGACDGARPASYSNTGYWVDFSLPADGVVSTYVKGMRRCEDTTIEYVADYASWSGTSFAAPQVSGLLAGLLSDGHRPSAAVAELKRRAVRADGVGRLLRTDDRTDG